jgi:hypothetical protein
MPTLRRSGSWSSAWQEIMFCVGNEQIKTELVTLIETRLGGQLLERCAFALLPSFR